MLYLEGNLMTLEERGMDHLIDEDKAIAHSQKCIYSVLVQHSKY